MNSWRQLNLLQVAFFSYLATGLCLFMLPWHRDYVGELCLYLSPACLILAILGQWLFIDIKLMILVAMASLAYLHQAPVVAIHPPQQQALSFRPLSAQQKTATDKHRLAQQLKKHHPSRATYSNNRGSQSNLPRSK